MLKAHAWGFKLERIFHTAHTPNSLNCCQCLFKDILLQK